MLQDTIWLKYTCARVFKRYPRWLPSPSLSALSTIKAYFNKGMMVRVQNTKEKYWCILSSESISSAPIVLNANKGAISQTTKYYSKALKWLEYCVLPSILHISKSKTVSTETAVNSIHNFSTCDSSEQSKIPNISTRFGKMKLQVIVQKFCKLAHH